MRVGLLSFIKSDNYGACLQAWSLYNALTELGCDCEYIDYRRPYTNDVVIWLLRKIYSQICGIDDYPSYTIRAFIEELTKRTEIKGYGSDERKALFKEFWELCKYSEPVSKKNLYRIEKKYDVVISGSDQIWNPGELNLDTTYLLDFVNGGNERRNSYASSIALGRIPPKYRKDYLNGLQRFAQISVREKCGAVDELQTLLPNKKIVIMPDPVFLTDIQRWIELSDESMTLPDEGKYIFVYDILRSSGFINSVSEIASHIRKCPIRRVFSTDIGEESTSEAVGPRQWLSLIHKSGLVVTNSFHAVCFSLIFGRPFIYIGSDHPRIIQTESRINELLSVYEIDGRIIKENRYTYEEGQIITVLQNTVSECLDRMMPYDVISSILTDQRQKGIDYLRGCLRHNE